MATTSITQRILFDATPDEVYEALTDPKEHTKFTGSKATGAAKVGGEFTAWDGYITGRHLKLSKGRKIVQEWKTTEWPEGYPVSTVEFTIKRKGKKTELIMKHSNVPKEQAKEYKEGWTAFYWEPLKKYFSRENKKKAVLFSI
jgi:activator of HSP90 ATPase